MPAANIAGSHYESDGEGDGIKSLKNYYPEVNSQDPVRNVRLATTPGSVIIDNASTLTTSVRGVFQSDGFETGDIIVIDGTTVRKYDTGGTWGTLTGTLTGTDRVQMTFSENQAAFLSNGDLYASSGTSFAGVADGDWATLLSNHSETDYTSIASIGQRLVATYGDRFAYSEALDFDQTTTLNFYTAESAPDGLIAAKVIGSTLMLFGTQTIEPWIQTGDNSDPFRPLTGQVIQRGCAARDSIVLLDNRLFFIGNDRNVYVLNGIQPINLTAKAPWLARKLLAVDITTVICDALEFESHSFYRISSPTWCYVYDVATDSFHELTSNGENTYEYIYSVVVAGKVYAGSRLNTKFVELSRSYYSDDQSNASTYGTAIQREFTAHLPTTMGRAAMSSIRLEGTKGIGQASGQGNDPTASLEISRNKGLSFGSARTRELGAQGEYKARTVWHRNGRAEPEQVVLRFKIADFVQFVPTRVAINEV